jgi:hypothetical protein
MVDYHVLFQLVVAVGLKINARDPDSAPSDVASSDDTPRSSWRSARALQPCKKKWNGLAINQVKTAEKEAERERAFEA